MKIKNLKKFKKHNIIKKKLKKKNDILNFLKIFVWWNSEFPTKQFPNMRDFYDRIACF